MSEGTLTIIDRGGACYFNRLWCCYEVLRTIDSPDSARLYDMYTVVDDTTAVADGVADEDGAPSPVGVHTTNLLINAGCSLLVFWVLRRRFGAVPAWFAAALFAAHPAHVEPVVHMVGRADLLAALFFLAAWCAHGPPGEGNPRRWWLGGALFFGSLLSKESGAAPPAVLFFEAMLLGPRRRPAALFKHQAVALAPYALALVAFLVIRGLVLGAQVEPPQTWMLYSAGGYVAFPGASPGSLEVSLTMTHAFAEYIVLLLAPLHLSADYSGFPHHTVPGATFLISVAFLGGLVFFSSRAMRSGWPPPLVWLSMFTFALLPVSNLVFVSGIVMAERALYLPSVAAAGLVAAVIARFDSRRSVLCIGASVLVLLFAVRSALRAPVWSDERTLFEATVEPGRHHGHRALTGLCDVYIKQLQESP